MPAVIPACRPIGGPQKAAFKRFQRGRSAHLRMLSLPSNVQLIVDMLSSSGEPLEFARPPADRRFGMQRVPRAVRQEEPMAPASP